MSVYYVPVLHGSTIKCPGRSMGTGTSEVAWYGTQALDPFEFTAFPSCHDASTMHEGATVTLYALFSSFGGKQ